MGIANGKYKILDNMDEISQEEAKAVGVKSNID